MQLNVIRSVHALLEDSTDSLLKLRLAPLRRVEADLKRRFGASALEVTPEMPSSELAVRAMTHLPQADDVAAQAILAACLPDIRTLYESASRSVHIEETSGFFLNDLERVCASDYVPSDDDVVRARLRTTGVQEWRIRFSGSRKCAILMFGMIHLPRIGDRGCWSTPGLWTRLGHLRRRRVSNDAPRLAAIL